MIPTFSSTIRRREMDAVLTCMVDEKLGPGELNSKLIQSVKEFTGCDGAVAFRSPSIALAYALKALDLESGSKIMISALAPSWQFIAINNLGYIPLVLDVLDDTGLVSCESVQEGIKQGGRLLLLHETMGIIPDVEAITALGIPVIEDISHSVGAVKKLTLDENASAKTESEKNAGSFGVFSILGLEEYDSITGGGGAILLAPGRREWIVLKNFVAEAPETDMLPDMNSALAWIQLKEFVRNEQIRKSLFGVFQRALLSGKNKTFIRESENGSTIWSFPVVLNGSFKDVKQYASRKEIEIRPAYEKSVISLMEDDEQTKYVHAKSLFLRCVLFPLYPRLGSESATKIAKVLGTLP